MIQLSEDQRQALLQAGEQAPLPVFDPQTSRTYFLLPAPLYERVREQLEERPVEEDFEIPPGIRRSKEAFLRDLPELLRHRRFREKWIAYSGDRRIAIHHDPEKVIHELKQQDVPGDQYYLALIRERAPEPEEIDPSSAGFPDQAEP